MNKNFLITLFVVMLLPIISSCSTYQNLNPYTSSGSEKHSRESNNKNSNNTSGKAKLTQETNNQVQDIYLSDIIVNYNKKFVQPLEEEVLVPPLQENSTQQISKLTNSTNGSIHKQTSNDAIANLEFVLDIRETRAMKNYFHYYTQRKRKTFQRWLKRAEPYLPYIKKVFQSHGLPSDLIFLPFAESGFNPWAYSNAGAAGMWQFIPGTARNYGLEVSWWLDERRDPYKSTRAAAKHLKSLYSKFNDWYLVLAAYNTGEYHIKRALRKSNKTNYFHLARSTNLLYNETKMYVPKFMAILKIIKNLDELDFEQIDWKSSQDPNKIKIDSGTDLFAFAKSLDWEWSTFRHKNPFFKRRMSPPHKELYVYLPEKYNKQAKKFLNKPSSSPYADYKKYTIKKGDSWWALSRQFEVPIKILKNINNKTSNHLRPGQSIIVPATAMQVADSNHDDSNYIYNHKYRVKKGDNLWAIARKFDCNLDKLLEANNLTSNPNSLHVGEKLVIPEKSSNIQKRQLAEKRANYKVQKGDNLWEISQKFGVSIKTLKQANGLSGNLLRAGTNLYIPDISQKQTRVAKQKAKSAHSNIIKYIVKKGDNLWNIAKKFGVSHSKLLSWNNISQDELIHPGDKLNIYLK